MSITGKLIGTLGCDIVDDQDGIPRRNRINKNIEEETRDELSSVYPREYSSTNFISRAIKYDKYKPRQRTNITSKELHDDQLLTSLDMSQHDLKTRYIDIDATLIIDGVL